MGSGEGTSEKLCLVLSCHNCQSCIVVEGLVELS